MVTKIEKINPFKKFCLRLKLKNLEFDRAEEIAQFITAHPESVAKADNFEDKISTYNFKRINEKIATIKKLLSE